MSNSFITYLYSHALYIVLAAYIFSIFIIFIISPKTSFFSQPKKDYTEAMKNKNSNTNTCPPCENQCDEEVDSNGKRVGGKRKKRKNKGEDENNDDDILPTDPDYANIKTIREQRMVQDKGIFATLKKEFESLLVTPTASFCELNKTNGSALQAQCDALTHSNCQETSCCIWNVSSGKGKCMAGDANGAMYKTDADGVLINVDTYYYQNKCYGDKCPQKQMMKMKMIGANLG